MKIIKTKIDKIEEFRIDYLNSLPEFQELFLELMISNSEAYLLQIDNKDIGYAIVNNDHILIEFYVINRYISSSYDIFNQAVNELSINEIYCKSFDSLLLSNCILSSFSYSVV